MTERLQKKIRPPKKTLSELLIDKSVLTGREVAQRQDAYGSGRLCRNESWGALSCHESSWVYGRWDSFEHASIWQTDLLRCRPRESLAECSQGCKSDR
jgi:hypothetical protein